MLIIIIIVTVAATTIHIVINDQKSVYEDGRNF